MSSPTPFSHNKMLHAAESALVAGLSVLPITPDGTKKPLLAHGWKEFQGRLPTRQEVRNWFTLKPNAGLAVVGGLVSNKALFLDFDSRKFYDQYRAAAYNVGLGSLIDRIEAGYLEYSPNGVHWLFRCEGPVPGNLKLANTRLADGSIKCVIETRGEGGYAIVAPSNGTVHPSGGSYQKVSGGFDTLTVVNEKELNDLLYLVRCFDELGELEEADENRFAGNASLPAVHGQSNSGKPGDDFNRTAAWPDVLAPAGWVQLHSHTLPTGPVDYWRRPGKKEGISAFTGQGEDGKLYVFSSSTVFTPERGYSKFAAYALLYHAGDFTAAARSLAAKGYGSQQETSAFKPRLGDRPVANVNSETGEVIEPNRDYQLAEFEPNDAGNTEAVKHIYGDDFLYCGAVGWLAWDGRFWNSSLALSKLDAKVIEILRRRRKAAIDISKEAVQKASITNRSRINACIDGLQKIMEISIDDFDTNKDYLNCPNGTINLRTGQLLPHNPQDKITYSISVEYDPEADYSFWTDFLAQVIGGGSEIIAYCQQAVGYSLTGHTSEECLFYLYGPTRSGKGTFSEAILSLLGNPLSTEADFAVFTAKRDGDSSNFDLAPLKPARMIFASESTRYQALNPAKIKQLTGGNKVYCCFKHRDHFNYQPQYKIWLSSNWSVNGDVDDNALWNRVRVIEFPNSFEGKEDKHLKAQMKSEKVLKGILRWAVEGAVKWYASNTGLVTPADIKAKTDAHRSEADYAQMWLEECCEPSETSWESNSAVVHSYREWCNVNGTEPKGMKQLATTLRSKGFNPGVQHKTNGVNSRGVQGLKLLGPGSNR